MPPVDTRSQPDTAVASAGIRAGVPAPEQMFAKAHGIHQPAIMNVAALPGD